MKQTMPLLVTVGALAILSVAFVFLKSRSEDDWICDNGRWVTHGNPSAPMPESGCGEEKSSSAEDVTRAFYDWYIHYEGNPLSSGAYKTSEFLSESFRAEVDRMLASSEKGGFDPFLCAQDKPSQIEVVYPEVTGAQAKVLVKMDYYGTPKNIEAELTKNEAGNWKISGITCDVKTSLQPVTPRTSQETMELIVYFSNARRAGDNTDCGIVYGTPRIVPKTQSVAKAALEQLFMGPTVAEKQEGYTSLFSQASRGILKSIKIENRTAYIDFHSSIMTLIPNATASCGSAEFLASVGETVHHFRTVDRVIYAIDGNPETFYNWIHIGCSEENNMCDPKPFQP